LALDELGNDSSCGVNLIANLTLAIEQ
jgi:hypothetical protein